MKKFFTLSLAILPTVLMSAPVQFDDLSDKMKSAVLQDWNLQLGKNPDLSKACDNEYARAERLLKRLQDANKLGNFKERLAKAQELKSGKDKYEALRKVKRDMMFALLSFDKILYVDSPFPVGMEAPHESRVKTENTASYDAYLRTLDLSTSDYSEKTLVGGANSAITRASLNYDADKIVFSMRDKKDPSYNLYKINADGSKLEKLTSSHYNDMDPAWLPDGNIVFVSTRSNHYIRCAGSAFRGTTLARCDADGKNIYFISTNNEADFMPSVLDDGRIIYCRWEYVDKNIFRVQDFWTVNPDGTNPQIYWGGQSHWPDLKIGAIQIPDTERVLFLASGHHNVFRGAVAILDVREGTNFPKGIWNLTPHLEWTEASALHPGAPALPYNKEFSTPTYFGAFYAPFPLDSHFYLVSARENKGNHYTIGEGNFSLYLADFDGNMELIKHGKHNIFYGQPVQKRKTPRVIPSAVEPLGDKVANKEAPKGFLYSANVYENSGIPFGKGKYLRVIEHCAPTYQDGFRNSSAEWSATVNNIGMKGQGLFTKTGSRSFCFLSGETTMSILVDESHKRILGEIPIEDDGSVHFEVPSVKAVYFQILDENRKVLQTMRSSTHVMPNEFRGCLGCHATKTTKAPQTRPAKALRKPAKKLIKPFNDITFGFERYIQPILDKHCVACHNGKNQDTKLDLRGIQFVKGAPFTRAYVNLVFGVDLTPTKTHSVVNSIASPISCYYDYPSLETDTPETESVIAPMTVLSYVSPLVKRLEKGHNGVKLSDDEFNRLKAWIDLNCPFYGEEDVLATDDIDEHEFNNNFYPMFRGLAYPPKMRTCPDVDRAFRQDKYNTQADRLPKDKDGKHLPAIKYEGETRKVMGY